MATATVEPAAGATANGEKRDFRQEVTDRIVSMLENGVAPWQKPWEPAKAPGMPANPITGRSYRGGNAVLLMATGFQRGYNDPRWMTYKQATEQGWQVRRGEKGTQIEFWDVKPDREIASAPTGGTEQKDSAGDGHRERRLIHRIYTVFNASQIDGIPAYQAKEHTPFEAVHAGEKILSNSGATIRHDQANRAFYNRSSDSIHLPPKEAFHDAAGYYGTALHELAHWVGHPHRLNRPTLNESYRFGDTNYAKEELRAELASLFLAAERGIPHNPEQHAAYVGSWVESLRKDKNEIFRASHDASKAVDYLLALERERSIADESIKAAPVLDQASSSSTSRTNFGEHSENPSGPTSLAHAIDIAGTSVKNDELQTARRIAADALGESASLVHASTSGTYRGVVLGETSHLLVQQQSAGAAVLHEKERLDKQPQIGSKYAINYSDGHAAVRAVRERANAKELGR